MRSRYYHHLLMTKRSAPICRQNVLPFFIPMPRQRQKKKSSLSNTIEKAANKPLKAVEVRRRKPSRSESSETDSILLIHDDKEQVVAPPVYSPAEAQEEEPGVAESEYTILFKQGNFEKRIQLSGEDSAVKIYKEIYGANSYKERLFYEGAKISRHLKVSECGFYPGLNYVFPEENTKALPSDLLVITVQSPALSEKMTLEFDASKTVSSLSDAVIQQNKKLKNKSFYLINNGILLPPDAILGIKIAKNDTIDLYVTPDSLTTKKL